MDNGAKFCAVKNAAGTDCDYAGWDPNTQMFTIVAGGSGAIAGAQSQTGSTADGGGNSTSSRTTCASRVRSYATNAIQLVNNSKVDGPMIGSTIIVDNNVDAGLLPVHHAGTGRDAGQHERLRPDAAAAPVLGLKRLARLADTRKVNAVAAAFVFAPALASGAS